MVPVGKLDTLLTDLRRQPDAETLPAPFQTVSPLLLTEVLPEIPAAREPAPRPLPPQGQEFLLKLSPDLQDLLVKDAEAPKMLRLEVILAATPPSGDSSWQLVLYRAAPGMQIQGRLGPLVTVLIRPAQ